MAAAPIPLDLQAFLARFIETVEQLENPLILAQDPSRSWAVGDVLRQVQSSAESVNRSLDKFARGGLLKTDHRGLYRFDPVSPELADIVQRLMSAYRERRVTIIELIYQKPSGALQEFSDAFLFKKRP